MTNLEAKADEYRQKLRQLHGKHVPVYTATEVAVENGMVKLTHMGTDGCEVQNLTPEQADRLIDTLMFAHNFMRGNP